MNPRRLCETTLRDTPSTADARTGVRQGPLTTGASVKEPGGRERAPDASRVAPGEPGPGASPEMSTPPPRRVLPAIVARAALLSRIPVSRRATVRSLRLHLGSYPAHRGPAALPCGSTRATKRAQASSACRSPVHVRSQAREAPSMPITQAWGVASTAQSYDLWAPGRDRLQAMHGSAPSSKPPNPPSTESRASAPSAATARHPPPPTAVAPPRGGRAVAASPRCRRRWLRQRQ